MDKQELRSRFLALRRALGVEERAVDVEEGERGEGGHLRFPLSRQNFATGQPSHLGPMGLQRVWPKETKMEFHGTQRRWGRRRRRAISVSNGVLVRTMPRRLLMRCTCVSTQMAGRPKPSATSASR